jgi:hypothetical protein
VISPEESLQQMQGSLAGLDYETTPCGHGPSKSQGMGRIHPVSMTMKM